MPDKMKMDRAAFEKMLDDKLKAIVDSRGTSTSANRPNAGTWRGSVNPNERTSVCSEEEARNIMSFFRGVARGDHTEMKRALGALNQRTTLQSVGTNADGGYTVPYQFLTEVTVALPKVTPFADKNLIRIIPMESETTRWTKVTTKPATPGVVAEGATYGKSGVSFGLIELVARKIGQVIPFTQEILDSNQIEMVSLIAELVAEQLAYKRNALVTSGTGTGEPEGVMTAAGITTVAFDNTDNKTSADSVIDIFHGLKSQYRGEAMWLLPDASIAIIRKLKDSQGRYLWTDGFGSTPASILGRPVYENPDLAADEILFGNFRRGYVLGQRKGLQVEVNSSGDDWMADVINFKFRERYDGKVNDTDAFVKCTTFAAPLA